MTKFEYITKMHNIHNVLSDLQDTIGNPTGLVFTLQYVEENTWIIRIRSHNGNRSAKIELIVDEHDESVTGSLLRYRGFSRRRIENIMNAMVERF